MGARFSIARQLELGRGFRLVEKVRAPHLFAEGLGNPSRVVVANSAGPLFEVAGTSRFAWDPGGEAIYTGSRQVKRTEIKTGSSMPVLELAATDGTPQLSVSPDGAELALFYESPAPEKPFKPGRGRPPIQTYRLTLLDLRTGNRKDSAITARRPRLIGVCWSKRRAAAMFYAYRTLLFDLDAPDCSETVDGLSQWRAKRACTDLTCDLHWPPYLTPEERTYLGHLDGPSLLRPRSKIAIIRNEAELRVGDLSSPDETELVVRFRGPQYGLEGGRNAGFGCAAWSPDGRLLAGTLARWRKRRKLDEKYRELAVRTLEMNGADQQSITDAQWEQAIESALELFRFYGKPYKLIADLERRELAISPGQRWVKFAPHLT